MRAINRLSARTVQTLKEHGRHADGHGLYLVIDERGRRWVYMFTIGGKRREMGLGAPPAVGLADARELRDRAHKVILAGLDPIEERRKTKAAEAPKTFGQVADEVLAGLGGKNAKHKDQWRKTFYASTKAPGYAEALMSKPVASVNTDDVRAVLDSLWHDRPDTAGKVRGRIERVLDRARAANYIVGQWDNPARWRGHLDQLLPKRRTLTRGHQRAIPFEDVPGLMAVLSSKDLIGYAALRFTILTAQRENEVLGAEWSEFDLARMVWTIPGQRMKGTNPPDHRLPITAAMAAILEEWRGANKRYVFPGRVTGRPLSNATMDRQLERLGVNATPHGFRSTFREWVGEATSFPERLAEQQLAHVLPNKTERAYRRGDSLEKRREMMEAWSAYCLSQSG